ncbi:1421_t:CDS:2 [Racocetra fulgida]|uniref:1421_t:CDS:1 n=1 Tax=Racocetra fulgida TaxID=60492 RepID=A0A9N8W5H8_9GLOM|nr:1421_t:CDS:2 [Racocetra fulgida]
MASSHLKLFQSHCKVSLHFLLNYSFRVLYQIFEKLEVKD